MKQLSCAPLALFAIAASLATPLLAADATPDRLPIAGSETVAGNWLMVHRTYDANRYSPRKEITVDNVAGKEPGEGFTSAPLAIGDKIVVGQSYSDWATRGWIAALNAADGTELLRFYNVPSPGEPGLETWLCDKAGNPDCWKTGGGTSWVKSSYDPEANITYWGTDNPVLADVERTPIGVFDDRVRSRHFLEDPASVRRV
jgi:glucose dehydrogenase